MKLKHILFALPAIFTMGLVSPVQATGTFDEHKKLYDTIHSYGVRVVINDPKYCLNDVDGMYVSRSRILSVCQDNVDYTNQEVDWTANDLDTLRHEAHHMIQDCVKGGLGDGYLGHLFDDPDEQALFIKNVLGEREAERLMQNDSYDGHDRYRQLIELEAFATAAVVPPGDIIDMMHRVCR